MGLLYLQCQCGCFSECKSLSEHRPKQTCSQTSRATGNKSQLHSFSFKRDWLQILQTDSTLSGEKQHLSVARSQTRVTHQWQMTAVLSANQRSRRADWTPQRWCHRAGSSCPAFRLTLSLLLFCHFLIPFTCGDSASFTAGWQGNIRKASSIALTGGNKENPSYSTPVLNPEPCICVWWADRHHRNIQTLTTTKHSVQTRGVGSATNVLWRRVFTSQTGVKCNKQHMGLLAELEKLKLKTKIFASDAPWTWLWQCVLTRHFPATTSKHPCRIYLSKIVFSVLNILNFYLKKPLFIF